MKDQNICSC